MRASRLRSFLLALVPALAVAAAFWVPARAAARGWFPSPLDDVYIHFDFARALATGHPFEWIPGQGYSSGETAPLYAVILAIGHVLGFHGRALGVWAAIVAVLSVASLVRSTARLVAPLPWYSTALLAVMPLAFGVVDWALYSGMEVAPFAACLGAALLALRRARAPVSERSMTRGRAQWILGAWGATLVLLRPEAAVLVFVFAIVAARGAGARSGFAAVFRASAPGALATSLVALANRVGQGDPRSAGVQLKLLSSNPFLSEVDRARVFVENLVTFYVKVLRGELSFAPAAALVLPVLCVAALASPRKRPIATACLLGALGWTLLVSWNGNAPHHNFRYYAPAVLLVAMAAVLGLSVLRIRRARFAGALVAAGVIASAATCLPRQIEHFRLSTGNIRDQHIELAERIAKLPADARILVGDAGAIPFVSHRAAVDALGLGGYRGLPLALAAVHGEPATIELLEHLEPQDRPTHLALYPNWFRHTTTHFGVEIDRVTLARNVICGGPTKALYRADWTPLDTYEPMGVTSRVFDELDVADIVSEDRHGYVSPAPNGGWTVMDVLNGRFDGGRIIPAGGAESFRLRAAPPGRASLVLRTDDRPGRAVVRTPRGAHEIVFAQAKQGAWTRGVAAIDSVAAGERLEIVAVGIELRDYHVWIEAE